jgi:type I restriction enzyme S subunit
MLNLTPERVPLGSLASSGRLSFSDGYRTRKPELGASGFPILRVSQIGDGRILPEPNLEFVRLEYAGRIGMKISQAGDTILTTKGTVGRRARVRTSDQAFVYSPQVCFFRVTDTEQVDPDYLYYWLGSPAFMNQINAVRSQTDMADYVSLRDLATVKIDLPDIASQQRIGDALRSLDDQIDANRGISETLEEVARALFRSWFSDFDPVRGTATVPDDIRGLFPDLLADSPLGPVPEGWEVAPLGEHVEVTRGLSYTGAGLADEGVPLHNLNSIREGGGYKEDGIKHYVGEYRERDRVRPGDVIVANTEQGFEHLLIGCPAIVPRSFGSDGLYSHHIYRLRPHKTSPLTPCWLYLLLVGHRMHQQVVGYSNGTTVNMLPKDGIEKQVVAVPPREVVETFDAIVGPMFDQQEALKAESKTLAELRDTLLPKLISGEFRLMEAS